MAERTTITAALVALGVTALLAAAAFWVIRRSHAPSGGVDVVIVGDVTLSYPAAYARPRLNRDIARLDRLDLAATFPDFTPAGEARDVRKEADLAERAAHVVFIALTPDDKSLDPAERPASLYAPFLEPMGFAKASGLVMRRFQQATPYEGEDLFMTPPEGRAFWARCPHAAPSGPQEPCFTEFRWSGLNVALRFSPALLGDWERLGEGAKTFVKSLKR
jgi:hypothetical protein